MKLRSLILVIAGLIGATALAGCAIGEEAQGPNGEEAGVSTPADAAASVMPSLEEQKKQYEAGKEFREGQALYAQSNYEAARFHLQKAVELDPQLQAAVELLRICDEQLGLAPPTTTPEQNYENFIKIRIQADLAEADRQVARARYALDEQKNYDEAAAAVDRAVQIYDRIPAGVDVTAQRKTIRDLMTRIDAKRKELASELRASQDKAAQALLTHQKGLERGQQDREIEQFVQMGMDEMSQGDFTAARKTADLAIRKYPNNKRIRDLDQVVFEHFINWRKRNALLTEESEWRDQFGKIFIKAIPYVEVVTYEKTPGDWRKLTARRQAGQNKLKEIFTDTPENAELRNALRDSKLPNKMEFDDKLEQALAELSEYFNIPIIIDNSLYEETSGEGGGSLGNIRRRLKAGTPLESALKILLEEKNLGYYIRDRVVMVTNKEKVKREPRLKIYDISDLLVRVADFQGPDISFITESSRTQGAATAVGGSGVGVEGGEEIDDGSGIEVFGASGTEQQAPGASDIQNIAKFVDLIKETIAPGTWNVDENDHTNEGYIIGNKGALMVTHIEQVHQQIENLLKGKRRAKGIMVTIEARFLQVSQNFIEDINAQLQATKTITTDTGTTTVVEPGVLISHGTPGNLHSRTLSLASSTVLEGDIAQRVTEKIGSSRFNLTYGYLNDNQFNLVINAAKKQDRSSVLSAPRVTAYNNQRAYISILKASSYVGTTEVAVIGTGTEQTAATSPSVSVVRDGIVLDVRPTVSHDMKYVQIDLRAASTLADLSNSKNLITRLTQETATTGGVATTQQEQASITLPIITTSSIKTTIVVPDQGTVLLGGMAQLSMLDAVSEVPWFSKIPILGFFFTERAKTDERSNLLLLLRANINIMDELEEKQTGVISEE